MLSEKADGKIMKAAIECECGCLDQWEYQGMLGATHVVGCNNCDHIEYADQDAVYLNEDGDIIDLA